MNGSVLVSAIQRLSLHDGPGIRINVSTTASTRKRHQKYFLMMVKFRYPG